MSLFSADYSLHYQDNAHVFQVGSGTESAPNPGDGYELRTFTDSDTGVTYGAIAKSGGPDAEQSLAVRMIEKAKALGKSQDPNSLSNLRNQVEFINLMSSFYGVFGRNF